ncbi:MAG: hypothetical protein E6Z65_06925 [Finegoldia magna]|nr:hypothetical protein [Finegoldia magna]
MSDFSDVSDLGGDSDVGSTADVNETNSDVDFGDGDGVNDFDDSEAQSTQEDFEYHDDEGESDAPEEKEEMSSEETAEQFENEFDDSSEMQQTSDVSQLNETVPDEPEQEMSSDEYADSLCADFEEETGKNTSDIADSDDNDIKDEESDNEVHTERRREDSSVQESVENNNDTAYDSSNEELSGNEVNKDENDDNENAETEDKNDTPEEQIDENEADKNTDAEDINKDDSSEGMDTKDGTGENVSGEVYSTEVEPENSETSSESTAETDDTNLDGMQNEEANEDETQNETGDSNVDRGQSETVETNADGTQGEVEDTNVEREQSETGDANADGFQAATEDANVEGEQSETRETNADGAQDETGDINVVGTDSNNDMENDHTEKNAVFENVSYHQGQNDLGALGTCGPTSIANSLNRVTGSTEYTENNVLHNAMDNSLCHKSDNPYSCGGTTTRDVVNIIDNVKNPEDNIHTEVYEYDKALSVDDLANRLDDSGTVAMVGVDSATLWDQRGDVTNSDLFGHSDSPSDHWITVDSPIRDEAGNLTGFNVIDSGGGISEVSRDKFEAMYMGDSGHTVSDPTAILISNNDEAVNTYSSSEGIERGSNYKGSAIESDGGDPPSDVSRAQISNTEKSISGTELTDEQKEVNQYFRGDQFTKNGSFEGSIEMSKKEELVKANYSTTCEFNSNLDGSVDNNAKYSAKMSDVQISDVQELRSLRDTVPPVTEDTVMQKVISPEQFEEYTKEYEGKTQVTGCASKAADAAPFTNNMEQAYETLRLDYNGTCYKEAAENGRDMYVMRFTSDYCPGNENFPKMDGSEPWNKPPCTGTGYTGSGEHLVPEYTYGRGQEITDGAIYKVDCNGIETMVGMWNHGHFEKVK